MATIWWAALAAGLSVLLIVSLALVVRATHRLHARKPLHTSADDLVDPLPLETAQAADEARGRRVA